MKTRLLFLLWLCCGSAQSSVVKRLMSYEATPRSWQDARDYCRSSPGRDLVTVVTQSEVDQLYLQWFYGWFGLRANGAQWHWFDGFNEDNIKDIFAQNEPQGDEKCGMVIFSNSKAFSECCDHLHFFFCEYGSYYNRQYLFVPKAKTWADALQDCLDQGKEFMDFVESESFNWSGSPVYESREFPVWIGLYNNGESWSWSDGEYSDFRNWAPGSDPGPGLCGAVWSQNKTMLVQNCSEAFPFLCYTQNLVLVQENRTWEQALDRCQTLGPYSSDLLSLDQPDLHYAQSKAQNSSTSKVWVGLRFLAGSWFWSNRAEVSLSGLPSCPESRLGCGALVWDRTSTGSQPKIEPSDCSERLNLLCYRP